MEDLTAKALDAMVEKIIKDNQRDIAEALFSGSTDKMSIGELFSLMTMNCLSLSLKLSVNVTLDLLRTVGNVQIDEEELANLYLKHL